METVATKGCLISVIVLVGIGWWFIRNAVLYEGDFIAMNARRNVRLKQRFLSIIR